MSRNYTPVYERMASVIFLLMKAPRTRTELRIALGMPDNTTSITSLTRVLTALEGEGLIEMVGTRVRRGIGGRQQKVYAWNPVEPVKPN